MWAVTILWTGVLGWVWSKKSVKWMPAFSSLYLLFCQNVSKFLWTELGAISAIMYFSVIYWLCCLKLWAKWTFPPLICLRWLFSSHEREKILVKGDLRWSEQKKEEEAWGVEEKSGRFFPSLLSYLECRGCFCSYSCSSSSPVCSYNRGLIHKPS